jgi:hypothetical protein
LETGFAKSAFKATLEPCSLQEDAEEDDGEEDDSQEILKDLRESAGGEEEDKVNIYLQAGGEEAKEMALMMKT